MMGRDRRIADLAARGLLDSEIAARLRVSWQAVHRVLAGIDAAARSAGQEDKPPAGAEPEPRSGEGREIGPAPPPRHWSRPEFGSEGTP